MHCIERTKIAKCNKDNVIRFGKTLDDDHLSTDRLQVYIEDQSNYLLETSMYTNEEHMGGVFNNKKCVYFRTCFALHNI